MSSRIEPLQRLVFDAQRLMADHPPVWRNRNKQAVYAIGCPAGCVHQGQLVYSRWRAMALPDHVAAEVASRLVEGREDVYDYAPMSGSVSAVEWHVNFADPNLFVAYGSGLLAQDELQVVEHPALGALKEALEAGGHIARTVESGRPTPVLVMGVERRCRLATDRNAAEGRPGGLYGNAFARAGEEVVRRATHPIHPPTVSNLIAMAAPASGRGTYDHHTIEVILTTALTGFRAAVLETARIREQPSSVLVHTGFWGCGAFGGHRVLMAMLQIFSAAMAGLDRLVFHTFDASGTNALAEAGKRIAEVAGSAIVDTRQLIESICAMDFEWGVSDGN